MMRQLDIRTAAISPIINAPAHGLGSVQGGSEAGREGTDRRNFLLVDEKKIEDAHPLIGKETG